MTLAQGLPGYTWHFVVPEHGPFVEVMRSKGYDVQVIPLPKRVGTSSIRRLAGYIRSQRIHIVHTHGARANFYGRLGARIAGAPIILSTIHNSLFDYPVSRFKRWLYVSVDRWTARFADRIVCVADALARDLIHRYRIPPSKVLTIHNGIDVASLQVTRPAAQVRQELGIALDAPVIGEIARMTEQKGFSDLIQAVKLLIERYPRLRCLLVGDGPLRSHLERECEAVGLAVHCVFTGLRADVADLLSILDVYVLPSVSEGFPIGLLEAMAMGRPVVATRVSGIPEIIADGVSGILVPPRNPRTLAEAIGRLLQDPQGATAMGLAARRTVEERFTSTAMVNKLEAMYRALIQEKLASPRLCPA